MCSRCQFECVALGSTETVGSFEAQFAMDRPKHRARLNRNGADETMFLLSLVEVADANQSPTARKFERDNVDPVFA